jgi:vancomycin permeability regulator SanA
MVIIYDGLTDEIVASDVAVILGNKVNEDGSLSPRLKARLDKGLELYQDSIVKTLFVSGGIGKENQPEGTRMAEYLIAKGVMKDAVVIDDFGNNTRYTVENVRNRLTNQRSIIVVTQYHHITRSKLAFKQGGFNEVYGAHAEYFEWRDFYSCFREFFAFYKYLWLN